MINRITHSASIVLDTPPQRNPIEYARAKKIKLPKGSAESGLLDPDRAPYMKPISSASIDPRYSQIVLACATQMMKTLLAFLCIMHKLDESPVPCLYISPSRKLTETISGKFSSFVRENESIYAKLAKGKRDKITEKHFAGIRLGFGWASSAVELSSNEAGLVIVDERDRMKNDIQGEGDPVELLQARTATYPDAKIIIISTPTIEGVSQIWHLWEEGTRMRWNVPCPKCNDFFSPCLAFLKWEYNKAKDEVENAYLECPNCEEKIQDKYRIPMNHNGKYIPDIPESENTIASFWVSGLCSPWRSYIKAANSFTRANKSNQPGRVQASVNTIFGELWKIKGEKPSYKQVQSLKCGLESNKLPEDTKTLTCGIDVHKDNIYYVIRAWGYRGESWTVDFGQLFTEDTRNADIWLDIQELLLNEQWENEAGTFQIRLCAIDSGFNTPTVYFFCQNSPGRTIPTRGRETLSSPVRPSRQEVNYQGRHIPGGINLFLIDDFYFKQLLHSKIRRGNFNGSEAWHLCGDIDEEFCKQMLSEELITKASGGKTWAKTYENHYLDCEKQNEACGYILRTSKFRKSREEDIEKGIDKTQHRLINKGLNNDS